MQPEYTAPFIQLAEKVPCQGTGDATWYVTEAVAMPITQGVANSVARLKDAVGGEILILRVRPAGAEGLCTQTWSALCAIADGNDPPRMTLRGLRGSDLSKAVHQVQRELTGHEDIASLVAQTRKWGVPDQAPYNLTGEQRLLETWACTVARDNLELITRAVADLGLAGSRFSPTGWFEPEPSDPRGIASPQRSLLSYVPWIGLGAAPPTLPTAEAERTAAERAISPLPLSVAGSARRSAGSRGSGHSSQASSRALSAAVDARTLKFVEHGVPRRVAEVVVDLGVSPSTVGAPGLAPDEVRMAVAEALADQGMRVMSSLEASATLASLGAMVAASVESARAAAAAAAALAEACEPRAEACEIAGCDLPRFVEADGRVHPFCGRTHASLGAALEKAKAKTAGKGAAAPGKVVPTQVPLSRQVPPPLPQPVPPALADQFGGEAASSRLLGAGSGPEAEAARRAGLAKTMRDEAGAAARARVRARVEADEARAVERAVARRMAAEEARAAEESSDAALVASEERRERLERVEYERVASEKADARAIERARVRRQLAEEEARDEALVASEELRERKARVAAGTMSAAARAADGVDAARVAAETVSAAARAAGEAAARGSSAAARLLYDQLKMAQGNAMGGQTSAAALLLHVQADQLEMACSTAAYSLLGVPSGSFGVAHLPLVLIRLQEHWSTY